MIRGGPGYSSGLYRRRDQPVAVRTLGPCALPCRCIDLPKRLRKLPRRLLQPRRHSLCRLLETDRTRLPTPPDHLPILDQPRPRAGVRQPLYARYLERCLRPQRRIDGHRHHASQPSSGDDSRSRRRSKRKPQQWCGDQHLCSGRARHSGRRHLLRGRNRRRHQHETAEPRPRLARQRRLRARQHDRPDGRRADDAGAINRHPHAGHLCHHPCRRNGRYTGTCNGHRDHRDRDEVSSERHNRRHRQDNLGRRDHPRRRLHGQPHGHYGRAGHWRRIGWRAAWPDDRHS